MSRHHIIERKCGGTNGRKNILEVSQVEHAVIHFERFKGAATDTEALDEFNAAMGQAMSLPPKERERFYEMVQVRLGVKVRFF